MGLATLADSLAALRHLVFEENKVGYDELMDALESNFRFAEPLRAARENPEQHRDLVVRVSGFSAYYVELSDDVQEDILRRRAHS
jgi:pyruvate-formate lyase